MTSPSPEAARIAGLFLVCGVLLGLTGVTLPAPALAPLVGPGSTLILAGMILFVWLAAQATNPIQIPREDGGAFLDEAPPQLGPQAARAEAARIIAEAARSAESHTQPA